jgi:hypothetical protein
MKKGADDAQSAIISSSEKVILDFLDRDIAAHPERLQPVTAEQVRRIQSLVGDVSVEFDTPLPPDDASLRSAEESLGSSAEQRCQWPFILTRYWTIKLTHPDSQLSVFCFSR